MKIKNHLLSVHIMITILSFPVLFYSQNSRLIITDINAPSLSGNLIGTPVTQTVAVYLPPSYDNSDINYPVVYFLPGYGDRVQFWTNGNYQNFKLKEAMDRLIGNGTLKEFIVVIPSGYNFLGGSFYVNSPVTGNWEDFIINDVVNYIDENYRTINSPDSRGISGHSMGGFGSIHLAMRHPDVFGSVYSLSPGIFDAKGLENCQLFKSQTFIKQIIQKIEDYSSLSNEDALASLQTYIQGRFTNGDWDTPFAFAYGATFSSDPNKKVPYINFPYSKSGTELLLDSAKLRNYENGYGGFAEKVAVYRDNLLKLNKITIDYGLNDYYQWIPQGCKYFSSLLTAGNIEHDVKTFTGGHEDQVRKRIEEFLLPSFSQNLVFDTTTTGIKLNKITPQRFELFQNYPNPFNPETVISYQIPVGTRRGVFVHLKIYDTLGRIVTTLVDKQQEAGTYSIRFNAANLPSGIYFCGLQAGDFTDVKKMMLLR